MEWTNLQATYRLKTLDSKPERYGRFRVMFIYLALLLVVLEGEGDERDVLSFLPVNTPRIDRLSQVLVDSVRGLVVDGGVPFLERSLEPVGYLVLAHTHTIYTSDCRPFIN